MSKPDYDYLNLSLSDLPGEIWKDVPGFLDYYQVSNYGRVKALERWIERKSGKGDLHLKERILKQVVHKRLNPYTQGYKIALNVGMMKDAKRTDITTARLVYYLFVKKFDLSNKKLTVVTKDGDNLNIRFNNLELITKSEVQVKTYKQEKKRRPVKIISQYDHKGTLFKTYNSIVEASEQTGINANNISQVATGNLSHICGWIWRFGSRKKIKAVKFPYKNVRQVGQYAETGRLIKQFFSITEAEKLTGFDSIGITDCAKKRRKTYKGFVWKYID